MTPDQLARLADMLHAPDPEPRRPPPRRAAPPPEPDPMRSPVLKLAVMLGTAALVVLAAPAAQGGTLPSLTIHAAVTVTIGGGR